MPEQPTISVVMSVYNGAEVLPRALDSILAQTCRDFELIVINDGSSDRTPQILRDCRDPRLRVSAHPQNLGLTVALNRGLRAARGDWIARCDADDWNDPRRFERQLDFALSNDLDVCFCDWLRRFADGAEAVQRDSRLMETKRGWFAQFRNVWGSHPAAFFRREKILALGGYDESFRTTQDYDLWDRCAQARLRFGWLPETLVRRPDSSGAISVRLAQVQAEATLRINLRCLRRVWPDLEEEAVGQLSWLLRGESIAAAGRSMLRGLELAPRFVAKYLALHPAALPAEIWCCVAESLHWRIHKLSTLSEKARALKLFCLAVLRAGGKYRFPLAQAWRRMSGAKQC